MIDRLPIPVVSSRALVPPELIRQSLALYKADCILIEQAWYAENRLDAIFGLFSLDFHRKPLEHLSRVQIVHYIGQGAFVLAGCMSRAGALSPLTERTFFQQVQKEACTFRQLRLHFRRYIPNAAGLRMVIRCERVYRRAKALLLDLRFELNAGACHGESRAVIPAED